MCIHMYTRTRTRDIEIHTSKSLRVRELRVADNSRFIYLLFFFFWKHDAVSAYVLQRTWSDCENYFRG